MPYTRFDNNSISNIAYPYFIRTVCIKLLIQHVWIDQLVMIRVSGDFKALVATAFDAVLLFDASYHIQANVVALLD